MVEKAGGARLSLATVPAEDPEVYEMVSRADTVGVFQIESRAQMSMLPRLRPACFYDLVIEVAIVRPGPIQGDMVHPYLRRRNGEEQVSYPSDAIRGVLEKTLGVPLFQEQAMRLAVVAAGFTPGEADQLRRAMGAWRRPGVIDEFHRRLVDGMLSRGLSREFAEAVFGQIRGFGEYGFPESHAASFALLVYVSAWLKRHHPAAFTAALLASQPMGFYAPAQLVRDARSHGVKVLPVDVNASDWNATVERVGSHEIALRQCFHEIALRLGSHEIALRLGLEQVHGLGEAAGRRIEEARRQGGPFRLVHELARRAGIGRESLVHLARAGAMSSLGLERRRAVWEAMRCLDRPGSHPLLEGLDENDDLDDDINEDAFEDRLDVEEPRRLNLPGKTGAVLPKMTRQEQVIADYRSIGLSLEAHPIHFERERLTEAGVVKVASAVRAPEGRRVKVAGIVLTRQRPATAKGTIFLTIEDETGAANIVVRPAVWHAADLAARRAAVLVVHGRIQRRGEVVHVVAQKLETAHPASVNPEPGAATRQIPRMSRDFC
jgi:error-prone DNA polymerase